MASSSLSVASTELTTGLECWKLDIDIPKSVDTIAEYKELSVKARRIHSSFLFHREGISSDEIPQLCREVFNILVKRIGGTKDSLSVPGWKDLGFHLGLTSEDINYINHSVKSCPTETVLRVYSEGENSTLGAIVDVLLKMERLDVIGGIYDYLNELSIILCKNENDQECGLGINLINNNIIKPKVFNNMLPQVLQSEKKPEKYEKIPISVEMLKKDQPSILLTYFDDGIDAANNIKKYIENQNIIDKDIHVICLEDEKMEVLANPEQYIRYYFDKVDYVVPIITEGYLNAIESPVAHCSSITNNIDCTYARYIYTLMSSHYINGMGCLNTKVRGILAKSTNRQILRELYRFVHLMVWTSETELNKFIQAIFMKKK